MLTVRSRARARNRARPTLAWLVLAILAALIALTVRIAAAEPSSEDIDDAFDEIEGGALDDQEIDEAIAFAVDELTEDQLEELGLDDDALDGGWIAELPADRESTRSPIGRVDLSLVYRRIDPIASEARDELLVLGTWRR